MSEAKLRVADVAGSRKARFKRWVAAKIIPPEGAVPAPGGKAFVYPQTTGAIFAVTCDLFDAGIVTGQKQLRELWEYFAEPHAEGCHPHITHVLDAVAKGEATWLIFTLWRHRDGFDFKTTCCTRFEDDPSKPIAAPSQDHEPVGEYIVQLHKLLERFAVSESNVQPFKVVR